MNYTELNLDPRLQAAIDNMGYKEATPIQEQTIPVVLEGKDVAGLAQTGTGKTAAFLIPLIERILKSETDPAHERAFKDWQAFQCVMILVPTRELADQIHENVVKLTDGCGLRSHPFYGGTGYEKQKEALKSGLHFIVSTPGRLIDLYKEHFVDFKRVRAIIFDEADRMFDMGFKDDMTYILSRVERSRQFLVFSATLNFDVLNTAYQFGSEPIEINISRDQATADNVKDAIFHIGHADKPAQLLSLLKRENPRQVIIFTNFKNNVDRFAHFLTVNKIPAMGISSLMNQTQRNGVIAKFKAENNQNVLVATDVAARGLDITDVDLVINYEMPQDAESYVHRIGRTGRAGKTGKAFSFISDRDVDSLTRVEDYVKRKIDVQFLEDSEIVKDFIPLESGDPSFKKSFDRKARPGSVRGGRGGEGRFDAGRGSAPRDQGSRDRRPPRGEFRKDGPPRNFEARPARDFEKSDGANGPAAGAPTSGTSRRTGGPGQTIRNEERRDGGGAKSRGPRHGTARPSGNPNASGIAASTQARSPQAASTSPKRVYRNGNSQPASGGAGSKIKAFFRKIFG